MKHDSNNHRLLLASLLAATLSLLLCLGSCASSEWGESSTTIPSVSDTSEELTVTADPSAFPPSLYYLDPRSFSAQDGRIWYDDGTAKSTKTGIDVSEYQGVIDWEAVAADGIDFAFLRVGYRGSTEGQLYADEHFTSNLMAAREAGIECGVYFFSQATSVEEAQEEAALTLELLGGYPLEYPVAFDYEAAPGTRAAEVDKDTVTQLTKAFCDAIRAGGYEVMIYGNRYHLRDLDYFEVADYLVWLADYSDTPTYEHPLAIWQYASEGTVAGIDTNVDLNLDLRDVIAE